MPERTPSKSEIFDVVQAQSETIDKLSERLVGIEQLADKQESRNVDIIKAVLVAAVLIVATIAVQISISDKRDRGRSDQLLERVHSVEEKGLKLEINQSEFKNNLDSIRIRNPYLK